MIAAFIDMPVVGQGPKLVKFCLPCAVSRALSATIIRTRLKLKDNE